MSKRIVITSDPKLRKYFNKQLRKDEQLLWIETVYENKSAQLKMISLLTKVFMYCFLLLIILIGLSMTLYPTGVFSPTLEAAKALCGIVLASVAIGIFATAYEVKKPSYKKEYVAISNQRIFFSGLAEKNFELEDFDQVSKQQIKGKDRLVFDGSTKQNLVIPGEYNVHELYDLIQPYWQAESPSAQIDKTLQEIKGTYQLQQTTTNGKIILSGIYKGNEISLSINETLPLQKLAITVVCANPSDSYLHFVEENLKAKITMLLGQEEHKTMDSKFDDAFFLVSDNKGLVEKMFYPNQLRSDMLDCQLFADCSWTFGKKKTSFKDQVDPLDSSYTDKEDVLDSQLIQQSTTEKKGTEEEIEWQEDLTSELVFVAKVKDSNRNIGKLLLKGMESTVRIAEEMDRYHRSV